MLRDILKGSGARFHLLLQAPVAQGGYFWLQRAEGCCLGVLSTFKTQKSAWPMQPGEMKVGTRADPPVCIHQ